MWDKIIHPFSDPPGTYHERITNEEADSDFHAFRTNPNLWQPVIDTPRLVIYIWDTSNQVWMYVKEVR